MAPRTYLFVPGDRPERFEKALASGADAVVLDLEDAVAAEAKGRAREAIARWCGAEAQAHRARVVVRINDLRAPEATDDLAMLRDSRVAAVMLPKAEDADQVKHLRGTLPEAAVIALVETARGVAQAQAVAAARGVVRLAFGTLDYALDLDLDIADSAEGLAHGAAAIASASRLAELPAPIAGVTPQLDDEPRLLSDLAWARRHGFAAKLCIHPRQVTPIHAALAPSAQAVEWARRVLAAEAASPGAAQLDGRMIDRPVVLQARRTLQRAGT